MLNMIESRVMEHAWRPWEPQIIYVQHQTRAVPRPHLAAAVRRADRVAACHPLMSREVNMIGMAMAKGLDEHGQVGATHMGTGSTSGIPATSTTSATSAIPFRSSPKPRSTATPRRTSTPSTNSPPRARDSAPKCSIPARGKADGGASPTPAITCMRPICRCSISRSSTASRWRTTSTAPRATPLRSSPRSRRSLTKSRAKQRDAPTAAAATAKSSCSTASRFIRRVKPDEWVVLMDQPFSGLVKELLEPQVYPALTQRPYDVTGWTLPMQMGVEVHPVTTPLSKQFRDSLRPIKEITGLAAPFQLSANASYRAVNEILAAKGSVSLAGDQIATSSLDASKLNSILAENRLKAAPPKDAGKAVKPARVGLYRSWVASIDEGWTRWILEQYKFPFTSVYNADIRAGHLHDRFDTIVIPDMNERSDHRRPSRRYDSRTLRGRYRSRTASKNCAISSPMAAHSSRSTMRRCSPSINSSCRSKTRSPAPTAGPFFCSGCSAHRAHRRREESADRRHGPRYDRDVRARSCVQHQDRFQGQSAGALSPRAHRRSRAATCPVKTASKAKSPRYRPISAKATSFCSASSRNGVANRTPRTNSSSTRCTCRSRNRRQGIRSVTARIDVKPGGAGFSQRGTSVPLALWRTEFRRRTKSAPQELSTRSRYDSGDDTMKQMRQKLLAAAGFLVCAVVCWRSLVAFEGTEFGGGTLARNQGLAALLYLLLALILTFQYPRIAAVSALIACYFSLPLYLYLVFPRPFREVWPGKWSVPLCPTKRSCGMDGGLRGFSSQYL